MSISNAFGADWHNLVLNATPITGIADNASTSPVTEYYVALHTASPAVGGSQTTSEVAYTSYARVAIERDGTRWTVLDRVATSVGDVTFPQATGGTATATHFSIGRDASGAGEVLYFGEITDGSGTATSLAISQNITPIIEAGATIRLGPA